MYAVLKKDTNVEISTIYGVDAYKLLKKGTLVRMSSVIPDREMGIREYIFLPINDRMVKRYRLVMELFEKEEDTFMMSENLGTLKALYGTK